MNNIRSFIIFLSVVLLIYGGSNYYIYRRIITSAQIGGGLGWLIKSVLLVFILAYPLSRTFFNIKAVSLPLTYIGAFWLAIMAYALLAFALVDLIRLSDLMFGWFPNWLTAEGLKWGRNLLGWGAGFFIGLVAVGYWTALHPVVRHQDLKIAKLPETKSGYRIAMFADTHLGTIVGNRFLNKIVELVNGLDPNLILIPGDVFDENPRHTPWAIEPLSRLKAKDGVIVSTGNHEFYAGVNDCVALIRQAGLTVLRDDTLTIPGTAVIAGLDDITGARQYGVAPKPIKEIIAGADTTLPLIVLHHTPVRIQEARDAGADMMISGHTHGGQQWPFGYVARMVFGVKPGLTPFDRLNFFLTVGLGTWGPPVRIGTRPEIILFTLTNH